MSISLISLDKKMVKSTRILSSTFKKAKPIAFALVILAISACQTGNLSITSNPQESDVFVVTQSGARQNLGKTPLDISMTRLQIPKDGLAELRVEKKGYSANSYLIPYSAVGATHQIAAVLIEEDEDKSSFKEVETCEDISKESINKIGKNIASIQALILKKDLDVAGATVSTAIAEFPYVAVLYDLQGNIYYLQKNYRRALSSYERSLAIDPKNIETSIMVKRLKEITGIKN